MPSYITNQLIDSNYNLEEWLIQKVPRLLDVFAFLREDSQNYTIDWLKKKLENYFDDEIKYYQNKIDRSNNFLNNFDTVRFQGILKDRYESQKQVSKIHYEKDLEIYQKNKAKFEEAIKKVTDLINIATDEIIKECLESSLTFLKNTYEFDYSVEPRNTFEYDSYEQYLYFEIEERKRTVSHSQIEIEEIEARKENAFNFYNNYIDFIQTNLKVRAS